MIWEAVGKCTPCFQKMKADLFLETQWPVNAGLKLALLNGIITAETCPPTYPHDLVGSKYQEECSEWTTGKKGIEFDPEGLQSIPIFKLNAWRCKNKQVPRRVAGEERAGTHMQNMRKTLTTAFSSIHLESLCLGGRVNYLSTLSALPLTDEKLDSCYFWQELN